MVGAGGGGGRVDSAKKREDEKIGRMTKFTRAFLGPDCGSNVFLYIFSASFFFPFLFR